MNLDLGVYLSIAGIAGVFVGFGALIGAGVGAGRLVLASVRLRGLGGPGRGILYDGDTGEPVAGPDVHGEAGVRCAG